MVWNKQGTLQGSGGGATSVPLLGSKIVLFGHSLAAGAGAIPAIHGWADVLAGVLRAQLWNQAISGGILAASGMALTAQGAGGIGSIMQGHVPPTQPVNWIGAWAVGTYYMQDDGVYDAFTVAANSTGGVASTALTTTGNYNTAGSVVLPGMYVSGTGVTPGTYVVSVNSNTSITLSQNATVAAATTLTFTGWYRCGYGPGLHGGTAPHAGGAGWIYVTKDQNVGTYCAAPWLPILMYGNNDLGNVAQKDPQPFLSALEAALARISSAVVWENGHGMVALTGVGTTDTYASLGGTAYGSGASMTRLAAGATVTATTPPDFPGGFVAFHHAMAFGYPNAGVPSGTATFSVDGTNVNAKCSGMADGPTVDFANPRRQMYTGTSLTAPLTTAGAITSLPVHSLPGAIASGNTIVVGSGATAENFVASAAAAANATAIAVTSKTPSFAHPIGDSVFDLTAPMSAYVANIVVRVPCPAGSHVVKETVGAAVNNVFTDCVALEATPLPTGIVIGLFKPMNDTIYWPTAPKDQDVDTWNTAIASMIGPTGEFPHEYLDVSNTLRPSTVTTSSFTAGQAAITSIPCNQPPNPIVAGHRITLGSGASTQTGIIATGDWASGSIPVQSFTSTYDQPTGSTVYDATACAPNFYYDGVHPSQIGHQLVAELVWNTLKSAAASVPDQSVIALSQEPGEPAMTRYIRTGTNLPTGVSGAWARMGTDRLWVPADPGDVLEVSVAGLWDAVAGGQGKLDIVTYNDIAVGLGMAFLTSVIHYLSGVTNFGSSLWFNLVGAQQANGLVECLSLGGVATAQTQFHTTVFYPVQPNDIINGFVYLALIGTSTTTTARNLMNTAGNQVVWSVKRTAPRSYNAES